MQEASTNNFDPNHARVLVVGPMASGKTTLVQSLCHGGTGGTAAAGVRSKPSPTIGCNVDVKVFRECCCVLSAAEILVRCVTYLRSALK